MRSKFSHLWHGWFNCPHFKNFWHVVDAKVTIDCACGRSWEYMGLHIWRQIR